MKRTNTIFEAFQVGSVCFCGNPCLKKCISGFVSSRVEIFFIKFLKCSFSYVGLYSIYGKTASIIMM